MSNMTYTITVNSLADTQKLAINIAKVLQPNLTICLNGELGAGKTTLIRRLLIALGINGTIKSPTFTLVEPYRHNQLDIFHFDLYRLDSASEWLEMGFNDYFTNTSIRLIEWAEKASPFIPAIDVSINIMLKGELRYIEIIPTSKYGNSIVNMLNELK